jgi:hypothetical protein
VISKKRHGASRGGDPSKSPARGRVLSFSLLLLFFNNYVFSAIVHVIGADGYIKPAYSREHYIDRISGDHPEKRHNNSRAYKLDNI